MVYKPPNLENFEFTDNNFIYKIASSAFGDGLAAVVLPSPIRRRAKPFGLGDVGISSMGAAFDITDSNIIKRFKSFGRQELTELISSLVLLILFSIFFFVIPVKFSDLFPLTTAIRNSPLLAVLAILTIVIWFYIYIAFFYKAKSIIVDRSFSERICITTLFYILLVLSQDDALILPEKKRRFTILTNHLVRHIGLFASIHAKRNKPNAYKIESHFANVILYIQNLECKAIIPTNATIDELRHEFFIIANIFFSGNYGDFDKNQPNLVEQQVSSSKDDSKRLQNIFTRFIGFTLPVILLSTLLLIPDLSSILGIEKNVTVLFLFAWLLLSIDSFFELGIVRGLANLAKDIKNLK